MICYQHTAVVMMVNIIYGTDVTQYSDFISRHDTMLANPLLVPCHLTKNNTFTYTYRIQTWQYKVYKSIVVCTVVYLKSVHMVTALISPTKTLVVIKHFFFFLYEMCLFLLFWINRVNFSKKKLWHPHYKLCPKHQCWKSKNNRINF